MDQTKKEGTPVVIRVTPGVKVSRFVERYFMTSWGLVFGQDVLKKIWGNPNTWCNELNKALERKIGRGNYELSARLLAVGKPV